MVYSADEIYIKAELPLPRDEYYDSYPQLDNGVGLMTLMHEEFSAALRYTDIPERIEDFTVATGVSAAPFMRKLIDELKEKCHNIDSAEVYPIRNEFFGETIDVAGLVTGHDMINQLRDKKLSKRLLIPAVMLRQGETVFLDDVSVADIEKELGVRISMVSNGPKREDIIYR